MSESESIVEPGTILADRYELTEQIGRGGFGMIYRARQLNVDRDVAVKVLPPKFMSTRDVAERFRREARLASRLRHPNTITVHDYGKQDDLLFIVMELLEGEDLADVLMRRATLPIEAILHIGRQVLKSLEEAHDRQIVHRDLKPENIFLTRVGSERDFVKVLDFGIAKLAMPEVADEAEEFKKLTMSGSTVGTPTYMSPEQAAGEEVDGRTDVYALGVILYEMACGRPPFSDDNPVKVMRSHLFDEVPRLTNENLLGTRFEALVRKALAKDREERFASASEFAEALDTPAEKLLAVSGAGGVASSEPEVEQRDSESIGLERTAVFDDEVILLTNKKEASEPSPAGEPSPTRPPATSVAASSREHTSELDTSDAPALRTDESDAWSWGTQSKADSDPEWAPEDFSKRPRWGWVAIALLLIVAAGAVYAHQSGYVALF